MCQNEKNGYEIIWNENWKNYNSITDTVPDENYKRRKKKRKEKKKNATENAMKRNKNTVRCTKWRRTQKMSSSSYSEAFVYTPDFKGIVNDFT